MIQSKLIDDIARTVSENIPSGARDLQRDIEKNLHAALQAGLGKLDLVTREEFEVQQGVLARTRAKLEALEHTVAKLEAELLDRG